MELVLNVLIVLQIEKNSIPALQFQLSWPFLQFQLWWSTKLCDVKYSLWNEYCKCKRAILYHFSNIHPVICARKWAKCIKNINLSQKDTFYSNMGTKNTFVSLTVYFICSWKHFLDRKCLKNVVRDEIWANCIILIPSFGKSKLKHEFYW